MAKILLIDDDKELLNVLEDFLIMDGHEIVTADDGRKGINLLEASEAFDLVITDIIMPGQDGIGVLTWLLKRSHRPKTIVITGGSSGIDQNLLLDLCKQLRADKVLVKPVEFETLREAICEGMAP